jgi:hypothetical protein
MAGVGRVTVSLRKSTVAGVIGVFPSVRFSVVRGQLIDDFRLTIAD